VSGFSVRDRTAARIAAGRKTLVTTEQLADCGLGKDAEGYDILRPARAHVIYQGPRVLVLLVKALAGL
jgi:hypothetical protein